MSTAIETVGVLLLAAFAFFVWPPAALLVLSVWLVLLANVMGGKRNGDAPPDDGPAG